MLSGHPAGRQFAAYRRSHSSPPTMAHQKQIRDGNLCQAPYATVGIPLAGRNNRLEIPSSLALQTDRQRRGRNPSLIAKPVTVLSSSSTFGKPYLGVGVGPQNRRRSQRQPGRRRFLPRCQRPPSGRQPRHNRRRRRSASIPGSSRVTPAGTPWRRR